MSAPLLLASTSTTAFSSAACLIALAMSLATFERFQNSKQKHELAWSIALAMFSVASFALAIGSQHGWNGFIFRTFFLLGAVINVPVLALGSLLLHSRENKPRQQRQITTVTAFVFFSAGVIIIAPFTNALPRNSLARGSEVFDTLPRLLAAVGSGISALLIIALAIKSAFRRYNKHFFIGNLLIALGTAITGASGLFNSVLGEMDAFAVTLAVGIAVIFVGFLVVTSTGRSGEGLSTDPAIRSIG